jgi:hypothetical protein
MGQYRKMMGTSKKITGTYRDIIGRYWTIMGEYRAMGLKEPPPPRHWELINNDVQLAAFKFALWQACIANQKNMSLWSTACRSMHVKFIHLPDALEMASRKIESDAVLGASYEERTLTPCRATWPQAMKTFLGAHCAKMRDMVPKMVGICMKDGGL